MPVRVIAGRQTLRSYRGKLGKPLRKSPGKRALTLVRRLNRSIERKYHNTTHEATVSATGTVYDLAAIAQGDSATTRDGNMITPKWIELRGSFVINNISASIGQRYRIILFRDKQQVADTAPAVTDLLRSNEFASVYNNPIATGRFTVLYDRMFALNPSIAFDSALAVDFGSAPYKVWRKKLYFKPANAIRYNSTASTDVQKNGLYMLIVGTGNVNFEIEQQLCFTDS